MPLSLRWGGAQPSTFLRSSLRSAPLSQRLLHGSASTPGASIPAPTAFVPDSATFLSLIGRNLSQHRSKIPDWQTLFTLSSKQMRELGIEPARSRRYLIWWRDRFRRGLYGVGGDLQNVTAEGQAELRVVEVPLDVRPEKVKSTSAVPAALTAPVRRMVVNETPETLAQKERLKGLKPVEAMGVGGAGMIEGPYTLHVKGTRGSAAIIKRQEGMWEVRRGHKVDGGERRREQVRRKKLYQEAKTTRPR